MSVSAKESLSREYSLLIWSGTLSFEKLRVNPTAEIPDTAVHQGRSSPMPEVVDLPVLTVAWFPAPWDVDFVSKGWK
jgi:hypothetical protein